MKKLSKLFLKDKAEVLNEEEMKHILGGAYMCWCTKTGSSISFYVSIPPKNIYNVCGEQGYSSGYCSYVI